MAVSDSSFSGSIAEIYDTSLVPLLFEPYAVDLARRVAAIPASRILEVAAGTGAVTRALAATSNESVSIVATDLNPAMLARATATGTARPVQWQVADAQALPFPDASFDAVVCQFGAMFFPDKPRAFSEALRVLKPGGTYLFSVWDRLSENEFAEEVTAALADLFADDPPRFLARTPHGYFDWAAIARDLTAGGFAARAQFSTVAARSRAGSARAVAVPYCQGTPLRNEIEARDASRLGEATNAAEAAIARRFGGGAVDGKIQAHVVTITR